MGMKSFFPSKNANIVNPYKCVIKCEKQKILNF